MASVAAIDTDEPTTWPEATYSWAAQRASQLAGSSAYTADLPGLLEEEDDFRATFGRKKLLAYHCTRLLPHELDGIRAGGLRLLDRALVDERIALALEHRSLPAPARERAESNNVYAVDNLVGREGQVCFVLGRSTFDDDPAGCYPLLAHWGGEAMRGGPDDAPLLESIGTSTIVVARIDLTHSWKESTTYPPLAKLFVGKLLNTKGSAADVFYRKKVPPDDVLALWQPGHPEYDRHSEFPR